MIPGALGVGANRGRTEFEPRVDLSMGTKIIGIPKATEGIRGSGGRGTARGRRIGA